MKYLLLLVGITGALASVIPENTIRIKLDPNKVDKDSISYESVKFMEFLRQYSETKLNNSALLTANANEYFDILFANLNQLLFESGWDPMPLPDTQFGFSWEIFWITYHGELTFTQGSLAQISTMQRNGDANINYEFQFFNVKIPVGYSQIDFNYDYSAKFMNIGPTGGLEGTLNDFTYYVDVSFDVLNLEIILQTFNIQDNGKISLKFTGNGLTDWLINIFTSVAITFFDGFIVNFLEGKLEDTFRLVIDKINEDLQNIFS